MQLLSIFFIFICITICNANDLKIKKISSELILNQNEYNLKDSHAPTILSLKSKILVAWFAGEKEGDKSVGIWFSEKVGNKWAKAKKIVGTGNEPCWNPVLFQLKSGRILLFYKKGFDIKTWKSKYIFSDDEGMTWSEEISFDNNLYGPVKNKPIYINNEDILCGTSSELNGWRIYFSSTKDLKKWNIITPKVELKKPFFTIQPTILLHKNGSIQSLSRTQHGKLAETWSYDKGKSFSNIVLTDIKSTNSGLDGLVLSNGTALLVLNAITEKNYRNKLIILSSKDGKVWKDFLVLENHISGQYSYPSIIQDKKGIIHIVYTYDRKNIKHVEIGL
ncbi:sialidase family protein [Halarcobacter anaerophilus]|uniref:sialidase family protein n=1 Tax=Halarcobacter anaerophilus TaxID=877500 RepID=UPI00069856D5|nr:sialidase family protein [Halarcobacter anaerophilus]